METNVHYLRMKWVCNTNCSFCNFYEVKWQVDDEKHRLELKLEIDTLIKNSIFRIHIWINGYEPTSYIYFFEILKYAKDKGMYVILSTNWVKLADIHFVEKMRGLVDRINITVYSWDDTDHHILTQNQDSYLLKHTAISNCLQNNIEVTVSILLLKNVVHSFEKIVLALWQYTVSPLFIKEIGLVVSNAWMWEERNKILIPSYTAILWKLYDFTLKHKEYLDTTGIVFVNNWVIPKCLIHFQSSYVSFSEDISHQEELHIFLPQCDKCTFRLTCPWIEKWYIQIYGDTEFTESKIIPLQYSQTEMSSWLQKLKHQFSQNWMWMNYEFVEKDDPQFRILSCFWNRILWYTIQNVLVKEGKLIKFSLQHIEDQDSFTVSIEKKHSQYFLQFEKSTNLKKKNIYILIVRLLSSYFNKNDI